jgi:hypothetical protein
MVAIPERKKVVQDIFKRAADGDGVAIIARKLNAEGVPPFGQRVDDVESGGTKAAPGERYGCGEWRAAYVRQILTDKRVLGHYQPRDAEGNAVGEVIPDYYPEVVKEKVYLRARARIAERTLPPGRIGEGVANLFGGLTVNARDGSTYYCAVRSDAWGYQRTLLNRSSVEGKSKAYTFPYKVFEAAILSRLPELAPEAVTPPAGDANAKALRTELAAVRVRKAELGLELVKGGSVSILAEAARAIEAREAELVAALDAAGAEQVAPVADTLKEVKTLAGMLEGLTGDELEDARLRLRSALRRVVDRVYVLVASEGRVRLCSVELYFRATGRCRTYDIRVKPPHGGPNGKHPGRWWCASSRINAVRPDGMTRPGLRDPRNVSAYLRELAEFDPEAEPNVTTGEIPYPEKVK